jgi:hypothetical protein
MKNLHDIIQKNMEEFEKEFESAPAVSGKITDSDECCNCGEGLSLELYDAFSVGYIEAGKDAKSHLLSSQLSIIQAIDEMIEEVMEKKEQVHGFQTYHTCDEECEVNCKRLRDERKIFFDGWDDGRNLMKIDLMRIRSFLNTKTKLQ